MNSIKLADYKKWAINNHWLDMGNNVWLSPMGIIVEIVIEDGLVIDIRNWINMDKA